MLKRLCITFSNYVDTLSYSFDLVIQGEPFKRLEEAKRLGVIGMDYPGTKHYKANEIFNIFNICVCQINNGFMQN